MKVANNCETYTVVKLKDTCQNYSEIIKDWFSGQFNYFCLITNLKTKYDES